MNEIQIKNNTLLIVNHENQTLEHFLRSYQIGSQLRKQLINSRLLVNGQKVEATHQLVSGDKLTIDIAYDVDVEKSHRLPNVVYEDDLVLVVKKPPMQIIHDDQQNDALVNDVASYYLSNNYHRHVRYIHRLDRQTQGLVFFSKLDFFTGYYSEQLAQKNIKREYLAIVKGKFKDQIVEKAIGKDRHVNNKYRISRNGKHAKTKFTLLKYHDGYSLVHCELFTGRTHQIRVHLHSIGFPIINDEIYGHEDKRFKDMGLYAYKLTFIDLIKNTMVSVTDDVYPDLNYFKMK